MANKNAEQVIAFVISFGAVLSGYVHAFSINQDNRINNHEFA
ncbi:hypothetical protein GPUN_1071 [Glaciecola punicea ACAM 611]|uniref:Uncharacterized protein n=1 Tax=Glaciecola punicea ACAM 611 TaxID=1121923 RepID=H5TA75_9ALTE|nr:hypothetical protein GPUN_1071 [Glaciecola punicea ACAM 611]